MDICIRKGCEEVRSTVGEARMRLFVLVAGFRVFDALWVSGDFRVFRVFRVFYALSGGCAPADHILIRQNVLLNDSEQKSPLPESGLCPFFLSCPSSRHMLADLPGK